MKLSICLVGEDSLSLAALKQQLDKDPNLAVDSRICSYGEALHALKSRAEATIAVVEIGRDPERAFGVAEQINLTLPDVRLVMTSASAAPDVILRSMRVGAEEFLTQPFNMAEVLKAIASIRKKIEVQTSGTPDRGHIIAVASNKGGVGATTLATNLAACLVAQKKSVCIVDLVLQFGSVSSFLNIDASYTILDLVKNLHRIDPLFLDGSLVKHSSGIRVLAEPFFAEDARRISPSDIDEILNVLSKSFDFVIVDTAKEVDEMLAVVLEKANMILFVTEMDVPSLKSAHRALELFERMGIYDKKIRLILNRYVKSKLMTLESVEKALGVKVFWMLPNNYPVAIAAVNQGLSIQECDAKSDIAKSYLGLTDAILKTFVVSGASRANVSKPRKSGLFSRLLPPVRGITS